MCGCLHVCVWACTRVCQCVCLCVHKRVCAHVCARVRVCAPGPDLSALVFSYTCLAYLAAELGAAVWGGRAVGEGLLVPVVHPDYTFLWLCLQLGKNLGNF